MNNLKPWKKRKRTGAIKRKLSREYAKFKDEMTKNKVKVERNQNLLHLTSSSQVSVSRMHSEGSVPANFDIELCNNNDFCQSSSSKDIVPLEHNEDSVYLINSAREEFELSSTDEGEEECDFKKNIHFQNDIKLWAIKKNIAQDALKELAEIMNNRFPNILPKDPRTILHTARNITIKSIEPDGEYWHNSLINSLTLILKNWKDICENITCISLNINFDGLPIYKSSKYEFWPILGNIFEIPCVPPFIIGIYYGVSKPKDLDIYLEDFVTEMKQLLNGIRLSSNKSVIVKIRCFICDSPARAFIKGVCNFNGKHGCLKCVTVGEYSHKSHKVVFPEMKCSNRTDEDFRNKLYGQHHKLDSPLLKLPIDIVNDFPVADSMHLIDLGVMKRLLVGWRDGNFGKYITKWSAKDICTLNTFLRGCKLPTEIHRCVRGLDCLAHWKASEYRSFLFYLSIIILPDVLAQNAFAHFLFLYCSITICSHEHYNYLLPLSEELLKYFVEHYKNFYGADYVTSNVHNLLHVTDEVQRFGPLPTFNAYPFENKLQLIKNMLRSGHKPLSQVAKRLGEYCCLDRKDVKKVEIPYVTKSNKNDIKINFQDFILTPRLKDKYFMTNTGEIIEMTSTDSDNLILGYKITDTIDVFDYPLKSSIFNIFKVILPHAQRIETTIQPLDVKFKFVCIEHNSYLYFIPLLHTV